MTPIVQLEHRDTDLGALLMCTAVFPGLKEQGYRIRYVCNREGATILGEHPLIDELIVAETGEFAKATAHCEPPQRCIAFPRTGYPDYFQGNLRHAPDRALPPHRLESLCQAAGVPCSDALSVCVTRDMENWAQPYSDCVLIHTTTRRSPYKQWPVERWALIATRIARELGIPVKQIGGKEDLPVAGVERIDTPSIRHAIAALKSCRLFIGLDSVFNHASRAVRKRSIILWSSTHPRFHGYSQNLNLVNGRAWNRDIGLLDATLSCQPCYRHYQSPVCTNTVPHFQQGLPSHMHPNPELHLCMANHSVDAVFEHASGMLLARREE